MGRRGHRESNVGAGSGSSTPRFLKEGEVLQSVPKTIHPDDWPCFVLEDAVVYGKDGKKPVNLLHAELEGPFIIRGKLEVDKDFRHLLRVPMRNNLSIEIENSRGFSMGIGPVTIWADGGAGWFEIRPSPAYQNIYDDMSEGVGLYFFLTNLYEDNRASKKGKKSSKKTLDVDYIFDLYAEQTKEHLSRADVVQRVDNHAIFLLSQMRKPREPIFWSHTMFYRYLIRRFPETYDRYTKIGGPGTAAQEAAGNLIAGSSPAQSKHNASENTKLDVPASTLPGPDQITVEALLNLIHNFEASTQRREQSLTLRRLCNMMVESFVLGTEEAAREALRFHAKSLLRSVKQQWPVSRIQTDVTDIILQLNEGHSADNTHGYDQVQVSNQAGTTQRKTRRTTSNPHDVSRRHLRGHFYGQEQGDQILEKSSISAKQLRGGDLEMDESEDQTGEEGDEHKSSEQKSVLPEADDSATVGRPRRGRPSRSGKAAALRLAGTPLVQPRTSSTPSDSENTEPHTRKRRRLSESSDSENDSDAEDFRVHERQDQDHLNEPSTDAPMKRELTITSDPLLTDSPDQNTGLWTCPNEGCNFSVDGAYEKEGKARVHAHFLQHADEIVARENLVLQEKRPHLPINNLLEKLRSLGEAARLAEHTEIGGRSVPPPIKRHMIA